MDDKNLSLQKLNNFIDQSECRINAILSRLGWSKEIILQSKYEQPEGTREAEARAPKSDESFPPSFHRPDDPCSIQIDSIKQAEVILERLYQNPSFELGVPLEEISSRQPPANIEELHVNFTREERLTLYEHVLRNTAKPPDVPEIKIRFKRDSHSEEKHASLPEIAAMERDARRRNPKHRVGRNPLTYNEEVRHLIHIQTEALTFDHIRQQSAVERKVSCEDVHKKSKRRRRSRSPKSKDAELRHGKKKRTRSRSRSKDGSHKRSKSSDRKRRKEHKKHKKKRDR